MCGTHNNLKPEVDQSGWSVIWECPSARRLPFSTLRWLHLPPILHLEQAQPSSHSHSPTGKEAVWSSSTPRKRKQLLREEALRRLRRGQRSVGMGLLVPHRSWPLMASRWRSTRRRTTAGGGGTGSSRLLSLVPMVSSPAASINTLRIQDRDKLGCAWWLPIH